MNDLYKPFGFNYYCMVSTMPEDHMGDEKTWDVATKALENVLDKLNMNYKVAEGEGAFYGPKIDVNIRDSMGRYWQCGTIQLDFQMPERFDVTYVDASGQKVRAVMIHRAMFGSLERFMGILIEHFGGAFPLWISPVQATVIPIAESHAEYASKIKKELEDGGIKVDLDERKESPDEQSSLHDNTRGF